MSKEVEEFNWWRNFYRENKDIYEEIRKQDWEDRSKHLKGLAEEKGKGLDYGSGPLSFLEFSGLKFDAIDPLMDKYREIIPLSDKYTLDTDKKYDWILCCNVLDHEEHPEKIISDIKNKLKPGGCLYLEINFDDFLGNCHYELYNKERVDGLLKDFKEDYAVTDRIDKHLQTAFYGRYTLLNHNSVL